MKLLDPARILSSDAPWFRVCNLSIDLPTAQAWFESEPHSVQDDSNSDQHVWAVEFDCGLKVMVAFAGNSSGANVYSTEPVAQHAARHLRHWRSRLKEIPTEEHEQTISQYANFIPDLNECQAFQLWRQGDDGNEMKIGFPTSERDVNCWQKELESHQHRQIYWSRRIK